MEEPRCVPPQDPVVVRCGKIQLVDKRVWIFYGLAVSAEGVICPDHDAIGSDEVDQEAQDFGIIGECVVMKSPGIILDRVLQLALSYGQPVINASKYIGEA